MATQKFIVSSSALLRAVKEVSATILPSPTVPILENVLLSFFRDGGLSTLHVYGSSMEVELFTSLLVESAIGTEDFRICLPAKLLAQTLANLPDQPITFTVNLDELRVEIKAARSRYKLAGENGHEYPRFKEDGNTTPFTLPAPTLRDLLAATVPFVSTDTLRPALMAVYFHRRDGKLIAAATNGHLVTELKVADTGAQGLHMPMLIPGATAGKLLLNLLAKQEGEVTLEQAQGWIRVRTERATLRCRLVDERYVDYKNVIPINNPHTLLVTRDELLMAIKEVAPFADQATQEVRFMLADECKLVAQNIDFEQDAETALVAQYDGEHFKIAFAAGYLRHLLNTVLLPGEVKLAVSTPNRAMVMTPTHLEANGIERLALLMPIMPTNF